MIVLEKNNRFAILIIAITTFLFFGICIKNTVNIDDELIFNSLPDVPSWSKLSSIFVQRYNGSDYRPIVILSFALEQLIFGYVDLSVSHGINVILYFLLCVLIFYVVKSIPTTQVNSFYFALFTSLLFIAHPLHSSVVSSLKSRDNILSMLLGLCGLLLFINFIRRTGWKRFLLLPIGILSLILALLSKLDAIGILATIPLYLLVFYPQKWKELIFLILIPFFVFVFTNDTIETNIPVTSVSSVMFDENPLVVNSIFANKISCAAISQLYYTKFMFIPNGYYYYFGFNQIPLLALNHPIIILSIVLHLCLVFYAIYAYKTHRPITFAILFYFLSLAYCLNYFKTVAGIVADRYAFIASLGFTMVFAYLLLLLSNKKNLSFFKIKLKDEYKKWVVLILILLFYFPFTFQRNKEWKDKLSLIEADLPHLQKSFHGLRIASSVYQDIAKITASPLEKKIFLDKSNDACKKAIAVYDANLVVWIRLASNQYFANNKTAAYTTLKNALEKNDTIASAYSMLADFYYKDNVIDSAKYYFLKAIHYDSKDAANYVKLTDILNRDGSYNEAIKINEYLIKTDSTLFEPYQNLANTALYKKDTLLATQYFLKAFELGLSDATLAKGIQEYLLKKGLKEKINAYHPYLLQPTIYESLKYIP